MNIVRTVEDQIKLMDPGSALFDIATIQPDGVTSEAVVFFIREEPRLIGDYPAILQINTALLMEPGIDSESVGLMPIILRIGPDLGDNLFETWLNFHDTEGRGHEVCKMLGRQSHIYLCFYDRVERRRTLAIPNTWATYFDHAHILLSEMPSWTMADYDHAKEVFCRKFPSVMSLCLHLHQVSGWREPDNRN